MSSSFRETSLRKGLSHGISSRYFQASPKPTRSERTDALVGRLEELLVFEIPKEGPSTYKRFSVRTLYKHVISAITCGVQTDYNKLSSGKSSRFEKRRSSSLDENENDDEGDGNDEEDNDNDNDNQEDAGNNNENSTLRRTGNGRKRRKQKKKSSLKVIEESKSVHHDDIVPTPQEEVTYRERLGGFLHPRDMRKLVTPFSASNEPEIIVRRHAILLNFDPMRAIILRDRLIVLVPDGADSILVELERRVRRNPELDSIGGKAASVKNLNAREHETAVDASDKKSPAIPIISRLRSPGILPFGRTGSTDSLAPTRGDSAVSSLNSDDGSETFDTFADNEWDELEGNAWIDLPFELQSVDAVLHSVAFILADDVLELRDGADAIIDTLLAPRADVGDHAQETLRTMKNSIDEMRSRVKGYVRALDVLLEDYEDMSLMNLSRLLTHPERFIQPVPQSVLEEESDEPELILESHLQEGNTLTNALVLIQGQIATSEEYVARKSDSLRNKLLYIDLVISVLSLSVAMGSFIGSIFGMNVPNGYEMNENTFHILVWATVGGCVGIVLVALVIIRQLGALPSLFR